MPGVKRANGSTYTYRSKLFKKAKALDKITGLSSGVTPKVKAYVKKAIQSNAENKVFIDYQSNNTITSAGTAAPQPYAIGLSPTITQGTSSNQRIGNQVTVKKAWVRGWVNLTPFNSISNVGPVPCLVKIWLCKNRKVNSNNIADTSIATDFFDTGAGVVGFQGNVLDMNLPNNMDNWHIFEEKTFKIGAASASATGPVGTGGYYDNSPMTVPFYFEYGKHLGLLKFTDGSVPATNKNCFVVIQVVYANGNSAATSTAAEVHWSLRLEYQDS